MTNKDKAFDLLSQDKYIGKYIIDYGLLPDVTKMESTFVALCKSIVSQQLSTSAADTIYKRFKNSFIDYEDPQRLCKLDIEDLRSVGLSTQKSKYIMEVSRFWKQRDQLEEQLEQMEDEEIVSEWTVHMLLIFHFHRDNILPLGDLVVRKGI